MVGKLWTAINIWGAASKSINSVEVKRAICTAGDIVCNGMYSPPFRATSRPRHTRRNSADSSDVWKKSSSKVVQNSEAQKRKWRASRVWFPWQNFSDPILMISPIKLSRTIRASMSG